MRFKSDDFLFKAIKSGEFMVEENGPYQVHHYAEYWNGLIQNIPNVALAIRTGKITLKYLTKTMKDLAIESFEKLLKSGIAESVSATEQGDQTIRWILLGDGFSMLYAFTAGFKHFYVMHFFNSMLIEMAGGSMDGELIDGNFTYAISNAKPGCTLEESFMQITAMAFSVELLLQFGQVETVVVNRKKRRKAKLNTERFTSEVDLNIEIIDSTYLRTIIRTEGFGVSGHFRLQACGPGMSERKLIWISPFQKNGYIRIAKKEQRTK